MTEFEGQVLSDLGVLKSQMEQLMGIGQPGRIHRLEDRVSQNEQGVQKMKGVVAAFGVTLTMLHLAISYFGGKHN
jgi:hypothetical protein